ncbi:MAG: RNA-binding protein [Candidatus Sungbacteria bacterium]|uniref:RNA-binding protein n=1 Tax=Candidatus Sungiibacteriota bacterium TaxID=2750080 RepID=A0A932YW49_9BACT|nr:RNA-binding protein [Candidatus Sungbacteria bacterium]
MGATSERITQILAKMGIRADVEERSIAEISIPYINIATDEARFLIGAQARNLWALEYLSKRIIEREYPDVRGFFLDVNGYRLHYLEELKAEAKTVAKRVRLYRTELMLKPMPPFERRIVHMALAEYPDITTQSVGEGEARRVVVKPYP